MPAQKRKYEYPARLMTADGKRLRKNLSAEDKAAVKAIRSAGGKVRKSTKGVIRGAQKNPRGCKSGMETLLSGKCALAGMAQRKRAQGGYCCVKRAEYKPKYGPKKPLSMSKSAIAARERRTRGGARKKPLSQDPKNVEARRRRREIKAMKAMGALMQ